MKICVGTAHYYYYYYCRRTARLFGIYYIGSRGGVSVVVRHFRTHGNNNYNIEIVEVGSRIFDSREIITSPRKRQWDWSFTTALTTIEITTCPTFMRVWVYTFYMCVYICVMYVRIFQRSVVYNTHIVFCTRLNHNYLPTITRFVFRINYVWLVRNSWVAKSKKIYNNIPDIRTWHSVCHYFLYLV